MEAVKSFIINFYLADYWVPLCIAAIVFAVLTFALTFFRKPAPLALTAWISLSAWGFGLLGYIEKVKDGLATEGFPEMIENLSSMYNWLLAGTAAVVILNMLGLFVGYCRRKHNARRR